MPTARWGSGAVHIPGLGDLVLGGYAVSGQRLHTAELLLSSPQTWVKIDSMIRPRARPSAVFFEDCVFVVSIEEETVELLSIISGNPGQWSILTGCCVPDTPTVSICQFEGNIFLLG